MLNLLNLIRNENMKIYRKASNQVMMGILITLILGLGLFTRFQGADKKEVPWQTTVKVQNENYQKQMAQNPQLPKTMLDFYEKEMAINNYRLNNNIPPIERKSIWGFINDTTNFVQIITLFTIVVGAGIVAGEFSWGTIKLLLIRPVSRSKILLAKYLATILYAIAMLALLFGVSFLLGGLLFGFENVTQPYLAFSEGRVVQTSQIYHVLSTYGFSSVQLIMMVTFAFMMSTIFRASSLAIGLSMFLMFTGAQLVMLLSTFGYNWAKYVLFANTDLTVYFDGIPPVEGMTLGFSIAVLTAYFVIFNLLSWLIFNKRDVAA